MTTISTKYEGKHCEVCGAPVDITRDHIIPKWLERRFEYFQLDVYMVNNDQYLCKEHNCKKGGIIDYKDERVRRFLKKFIMMLQEKIDIVEKEIRTEKFKKTMAERKAQSEADKKKQGEKDKKDDKEVDEVKF